MRSLFFPPGMEGFRAPELEGGGPWINSQPLKMRDLRGKVVLIDFWTYTCVNCLRTLPYIKVWYDKYSDKGLVIIGVHTPEFEFEKNYDNVLQFVREQDIKYSVVLDNQYRIWDAFANRYWPRKFLVDASGVIRYDHAGEGAYLETENAIQNLLKEADRSVSLPRIEESEGAAAKGAVCYPMTPELYAGYSRGIIGNREGYRWSKSADYTDPGVYVDGRIYLRGVWEAQPEYLRHARTTKAPEDYVTILYHGLAVNAVIKPATSGQFKVWVTRDGNSLSEGNKGTDVIIENGASYILVDEPRMYSIVREDIFGSHVLKLAVESDQFEIFAFTFGGCRD